MPRYTRAKEVDVAKPPNAKPHHLEASQKPAAIANTKVAVSLGKLLQCSRSACHSKLGALAPRAYIGRCRKGNSVDTVRFTISDTAIARSMMRIVSRCRFLSSGQYHNPPMIPTKIAPWISLA